MPRPACLASSSCCSRPSRMTLDGQVQLADVARAADSSLSRLSHAITRLEDAGLVERRACDEDRRASWAVLTPAGAEAVSERSREHTMPSCARCSSTGFPRAARRMRSRFLTSLLPTDVAAACATIDGTRRLEPCQARPLGWTNVRIVSPARKRLLGGGGPCASCASGRSCRSPDGGA